MMNQNNKFSSIIPHNENEKGRQIQEYSIMIVDDTVDIANLLKDALQREGFSVYEFDDPLKALEFFTLHQQEFYLIISDIRMPAMNGWDLVSKVKEINPNIKAFLMTAFEIDKVESETSISNIKVEKILQKPIRMKDLTSIVSEYGESHTK